MEFAKKLAILRETKFVKRMRYMMRNLRYAEVVRYRCDTDVICDIDVVQM